MTASWQPDDLGEASDPVGRLGAHALSSGNVTVRIGGVRDAAHLDALVDAMRGIRGVGGVRLRTIEPVHSPVVVLNAVRPIALASELRSELGRQVMSCVFVDGEVALELDGTAPDPAPRRARRTERRAAPGDGPQLRPRPRKTRHRPPPDLGVRPAPTDAGDGPVHGGPSDDDVLRRAIDEVGSLSVLTFDTDLRFVRSAGAMHERYDHRSADLLGRRPNEIVDAATWETLRPGYEGALAGRTTTLDTPSPDGRLRYQATFRPIRLEQGIVGGSVTLVDVTDVRREERRLEELRDVFASSFDGSPAGQGLLSPETRWMRVNPALERLLHLGAGALVDRPFPDLVLPRERDRAAELLRTVAAGERHEFALDVPVVRGGTATSWTRTSGSARFGRARGRCAGSSPM